MWPVIMGFVRTYAVYITFPVAAVVGFVGYNVESYVRKDKNTPWKTKSIKEEREERKLGEITGKDCTDVATLKSRQDIPKTVLDRNDFPKQ